MAARPAYAKAMAIAGPGAMLGVVVAANNPTYSASQQAIATLAGVVALEMERYGVTANALAPSARTRMTEEAFAEMMAKPDEG